MGDIVCQSNGNKDTFPKAVDWVDFSNAAIDCSPVSILAVTRYVVDGIKGSPLFQL